jgi:hypothetical protein
MRLVKSFKFPILFVGGACLISCGGHLLVRTPSAPAPDNGIYINSVKVYDEGSLQSLLAATRNNLAQLNGFDQASLISHLGAIQGSTSVQSQNSLQVTGPASATTAPNNSTPPAAPATYTLPSTFQTSAADFLNEQMQLSLQMVNLQLLLQGSLNDQLDPRTGRGKARTTLGFPINISVPPGFKYQGAIAEVEVSVCSPDGMSEASLATLLPQEKSYNVASLVGKSSSVGGGAVAGIVNVGGSFLRSRQTYYLVQDQDTLAMQRPGHGTCGKDGKQKPVTFAWQFRPVLGQPVVRDGLRQTFAQVSFDREMIAYEGRCAAPVTVRTGWRRYDRHTGRVGELIDPYKIDDLPAADFDIPPNPRDIFASDNGDGTISVRVMGGFRAATRVRIGGTMLDSTSTANGFEQNEHYIRFTANAFALAMYGAYLVYQDGTEALIAPPPAPTSPANRCPTPARPSIQISQSNGRPGQSMSGVQITGTSTHFKEGKPSVRFSNTAVTAKIEEVTSDTQMTIALDIAEDAAPGLSDLTVQAGPKGSEVTTGAGVFLVGENADSIVSVTPNHGQQGQEVPLTITGENTHFKTAPPIVTFSGAIVEPDSVHVDDDTILRLTLNVLPATPPGPLEVKVVTGAETATARLRPGCLSLFTVVPTPSITPSDGQRGQTFPVLITGAFPDVGEISSLTFSKSGTTASNVHRLDDHTVAAYVTIAPDAEAGQSDVTVGIGTTIPKLFLVRAVDVKPFNDSTSLVRLTLRPDETSDPDHPGVVLIGNHAYGLRDAPFYERTVEHVSVLVPNDAIRTNRKLIWKSLLTLGSNEYWIPFPAFPPILPPAGSGSDFVITGIKFVSYTAGASTSGSAAPSGASDVTVTVGTGSAAATVPGSGLFTIGDGRKAVTTISPASGFQGETLPVTITGALTHFKDSTSLTFSSPRVKPVDGSVKRIDDTHLSAKLAIQPDAATGSVSITAQTDDETAVGQVVFTVAAAKKTLATIAPDNGEPAGPIRTDFPVKITGNGTHFTLATPKVVFDKTGIDVSSVEVNSDTELIAKVTIKPKTVPGPSNVTVTTGDEVAGLTAKFTVSPNAPSILRVSPASGLPGQTLPNVTITGRNTHFDQTAPTAVTFSNSGVTAADLHVNSPTEFTATVNVAPTAALQKPTNTYAIYGSRLKDLQILAPQGVQTGPVNEDTLVTFSLTDEQVKAAKGGGLVVQHGTDAPIYYALPDPPAAAGASATPTKPSIKAQPTSGIPATQQSLDLTGTGMSQVVSVRYQDKPLNFTTSSDTAMKLSFILPDGTNVLSSPGIDVVVIYADKSMAQYYIPVQKPGPQ